MTANEEKIIMSHQLSPARQNALLSKCSWEGQRVRVACTHHTEPILRLAGISKPRPCETYLVPATRDKSGFLVVDTEARAESADIGELFHRGGLLEGLQEINQGPITILPTDSMRVETVPDAAGMVEETKALIHGHGRRFEVSTGPHSKIRLLIIAMDDEALPSPNERELWTSRNPTDTEVAEAARVLIVTPNLAYFER